jgi:uncharacterized membrane protein YhaH (DUF805 family)
MHPLKLFLDDSDVIGRRAWWLGTAALVIGLWLFASLVHALRPLARIEPGLLLFASLAALIPFHTLNVKRLRDRDRPEWLSAVAALPPAIASLVVAFRPATGPLEGADIAIGLALIAAAAWMVVDLGMGPSRPRPSTRFAGLR